MSEQATRPRSSFAGQPTYVVGRSEIWPQGTLNDLAIHDMTHDDNGNLDTTGIDRPTVWVDRRLAELRLHAGINHRGAWHKCRLEDIEIWAVPEGQPQPAIILRLSTIVETMATEPSALRSMDFAHTNRMWADLVVDEEYILTDWPFARTCSTSEFLAYLEANSEKLLAMRARDAT